MSLKYLTLFAAMAAVFATPSIASANSKDVIATTIPASACRPENDATDERVALSNGAYIFAGNATGTVRFYCPLPLTEYTSSGVGGNYLNRYNVYYRDTDGTGNAAQIQTALYYRSTSLVSVSPIFNSNAVNTGGNLTDNRIQGVLFNHTFASPRLYFFAVSMRRDNTNQNPAFSGIDFVYPLVP